MTDKKKRKSDMDLSKMGFDEAIARFIQTDKVELEDSMTRVEQEDEKVSKYVGKRRKSIGKGARRTNHRFRL